ncbi:MAG: hypothetical protein ACRDDY_08375 [Clostridium sp.]|uniref:hypothetical protein n=1 Tax=Clostridium sp. TaxID=1506 RepID=UPI003EE4FD82
MDKNKIVVIGTGGAGNKMLDTLLNINRIYTPVFCNTNVREMEILKHFNPNANALYIANAEGTGRDRSKAVEAIKADQPSILSFFVNKFSKQSGKEHFFIISSADGGSGSGSVPMLSKVIKRVNPNATVNLLIANPNLSERGYSLQNTVDLYVEIVELMKSGRVNSVQFIDNNKMQNEEDFNYDVMRMFDNSLSINNIDIDVTDSERVNTEVGYKVILELDPEDKNDIDKAINSAIKNSPFVMPSVFECNILMASMMKEDFDKYAVRGKFEVFNFDKYDYNNKSNIIVLGGIEMPSDHIELIKMELESQKDKKKNRNIFGKDITKETPIKKEEKKENIGVTREDLDEMMNDDSFWD